MDQGQPRLTIYTNFVELESQCCMPYSKIIGLPFLKMQIFKVLTTYVPGGHLGRVNLLDSTNFRSPFPRKLHMEFGFDLSSGFGGDV